MSLDHMDINDKLMINADFCTLTQWVLTETSHTAALKSHYY